jgi:membrane fusion protein (multidrug efflux system)
MKTSKKILIPLIILILVALAVYRLNLNRQQFRDDAALASRTVAEVPVKTAPARTGTVNKQVSTTGTIAANQELIVLSETQGKIKKIHKQVGDPVRKDEVIVEVDDETIAANLLVAEANYDQKSRDVERMERLEQGNAIAKHDLEQARNELKEAEANLITARKAVRDTKIKAPIPGVINKRLVETGEFISGGTPVCEIVNTSTLKIWIKIPEKDIFKLTKGLPVEIRLQAFPEKTFTGKINAIGEKADNSMKFDVEVTMANPEGKQRLKAGLFAEVHIPVEASETIIIEKTALVGSMKNPVVFVAEGDHAVRKTIITNESDDKYIEVSSGIKEGEQVIVSGQINLNDGDRIKITR